METRVGAKDYALPVTMLVVGAIGFVVRQGAEGRWHGACIVGAFVGLAVSVALVIGGCLLLTLLTDTSFGARRSPLLELAALFLLVTGLTAFIPSVGGHAIAFLLYFWLLMRRFSLNVAEAVPYAGLLWLARFVALIGALAIPLLSSFADRY